MKSLRRFVLCLLDPKGERERMQMRLARSMVDANTEDLARTMSASSERIVDMMRNFQERERERAKQ